jgi:hypothetical protein
MKTSVRRACLRAEIQIKNGEISASLQRTVYARENRPCIVIRLATMDLYLHIVKCSPQLNKFQTKVVDCKNVYTSRIKSSTYDKSFFGKLLVYELNVLLDFFCSKYKQIFYLLQILMAFFSFQGGKYCPSMYREVYYRGE